jgi:hypothetical protein
MWRGTDDGALRGASLVAVVKPAHFRHGDDGADGCLSDRPAIRGVLVQPGDSARQATINNRRCLDPGWRGARINSDEF